MTKSTAFKIAVPDSQLADVMGWPENPARAGISSTVTIHGVKIDQWSYNLPEDDFVMETVTFKGLWISVEDAQASA